MTDDQLIESLRARTWPGDCEAAAFRLEELRARVAELEALPGNVLAQRAERLESELKHWKSNHAAEVQRARVLKERTDMPLERVQAYEQIGQLLAERDALAAELKALRDQKPVAVYKGHRHIPSDTKEFWGMADNHLPAGTHLYARPVLSRELTDKVIERLFDESAFQENEMRDAADYFAHEIERYLKGEGE